MNGIDRCGTTCLTVNGRAVSASPRPAERLSVTLRERLGRRDVKSGCDAGDCGLCTVLMDDRPVCACLVPAARAAGRRVETLAGLIEAEPIAHRLAERFQDTGAAQCGICTPGMIVAATALLRETRAPDEAAVLDALGGVLCRCTGYRAIVAAVLAASRDPETEREAGSLAASAPMGRAMRRLDGLAKVEGREVFGDDAAEPGTLEIQVVRSPHPHAAFAFGDLGAWVAATPGMAAVLTAADVPGVNRFGVIPAFADQPAFAEGVARFRGEAVAAVIGMPDAVAAFEPERFPVTWTVFDAAESPEAASADGAPVLHPTRTANRLCGGLVRRGDADAALGAAHVVVEDRFVTGFVEHAYLEPEAGCARLEDGRVVVEAATQAPGLDREALAAILAMSEEDIRIVPTACGGGFGAKLDLSVQPYLALGALKTGRPVRLAYDRAESMQSSTKRHPADMRVAIGAAADGRLSGMVFEGTFDTGAYASWGPTVATRVPVHASGPYAVADYRARSHAVHTHNPPAGAFRGFGVPQAAIAQEALFDRLADRLGLDPLEFRRLNALADGTPTVCGQVFEQGVGIRACLDALVDPWTEARRAAAEANEAARATGSALRFGAGIATGWYGCGNTSLANPSTIKAGIRADGRVVLHQGAVDIGQGANTVIAQIFAEALGIDPGALVLVGPDTDVTPDAGKTSASRQTFVTGNAARLAGERLRADLLRRANAGPDARLSFDAGRAIADDGLARIVHLSAMTPDAEGYVLRAEETYDPPTRPLDEDGQGAPYAQFGYAAQIASVAVDAALGTVRVLRMVAAHDVGRAINPMLIEGQVAGGIAQGLGMALMEAYVPGRTENLHDYLIPTAGDVPPIETVIVEVPDAHGPYGAKGLGEHALVPAAPAILNAIRHATGAEITRLPATPERVLAAIRAAAGHDG